MRFAVATAIFLANSSLHAASFEGKRQRAKALSSAGGEKFEALLKRPLGTREQNRASQYHRSAASLKKTLQARLEPLKNRREGPLKNRRKAKEEVVECDPNALDLGVLACGSDQFCVKNQSSSQGGFCSSRRLDHSSRRLDHGYCYDYFYHGIYFSICYYDNGICYDIYDADVGEFGSFCNFIYCGDEYYCCSQYISELVVDDDGFDLQYYFGFVEPYEQYFLIDMDETGCSVSIDGETCDSCSIDYMYSYDDICFSFDCSNVFEGLTYDACSDEDEYILPILETCYVDFEDDEPPTIEECAESDEFTCDYSEKSGKSKVAVCTVSEKHGELTYKSECVSPSKSLKGSIFSCGSCPEPATAAPTESATAAPTESATAGPTGAPSVSPTAAPVIPPTPCFDDPTFRHKGERDKDCDWVAAKPIQRCDKEWMRKDLTIYCPRACGLCGPTPAPSTAPSKGPSAIPTAAPVTPAPTGCDPDLCFDDPDFKHQGLGRKDCDWVAKKVESRCNKVHNTKGFTVQEVCPEACASSDYCVDVAASGCVGDAKYECPIICGVCDTC